jgi:hypothetical protein
MLFDQSNQSSEIDWLSGEVIAARFHAFAARALHGVRGKGDNLH